MSRLSVQIGISSLVLPLASYIRYCVAVLLKTGLSRLKGVQSRFLMRDFW